MNLGRWAEDLFDRMFRERMFRATVSGTNGNLVTVRRAGHAADDPQSYPRLVSYTTPTADDEVIVAKVGDGWIVLGKVTR